MPTNFPTVRGSSTAQALAPLTQILSFSTDVAQFQNGSEQRFPRTGPLWGFQWAYSRITKADKNTLQTFFVGNKGQFAQNLQLTVGPTSYTNLTLMSDTFSAVENPQTLYTTNFTVRQTIPQLVMVGGTVTGSSSPQTIAVTQTVNMQVGQAVEVGVGTSTQETVTLTGVTGTTLTGVFLHAHAALDVIAPYLPGSPSFPSINLGVTTQLPYQSNAMEFNDIADMPLGERFGFAYYGSGLTNFPTGPLYKWQSQNLLMSDADMVTLFYFFAATQGRYADFSWTDPESGTTFSNCRFDQDQLAAVVTIPNNNQVNFSVAQHF